MMAYGYLNRVTAEYQTRAKRVGSTEAQIFQAPHKPEHEYFQRVEINISKMPREELIKLEKKFTRIIPETAATWREQYEDQFKDILVEVLGWGCLTRRYPHCEVQFSETPDLLAIDSSGMCVAGMECKKVRESDDDRQSWRTSNPRSGEAEPVPKPDGPSQSGLLKKLHDTLTRAAEQVNKGGIDKDRFVFLVFNVDLQNSFDVTGVDSLLDQKTAALRVQGITLIPLVLGLYGPANTSPYGWPNWESQC